MSFINNSLRRFLEKLYTGTWEHWHRLTPLKKISFSTAAMMNCLEIDAQGGVLPYEFFAVAAQDVDRPSLVQVSFVQIAIATVSLRE